MGRSMKEIKSIKDCYSIRGNKNIHEFMEIKLIFISDKNHGFKMYYDLGYFIHMKNFEPFNN